MKSYMLFCMQGSYTAQFLPYEMLFLVLITFSFFY
ncbi:hypothetical protein COD67_11075 [Bacillus cereus]|nr:hypothetical protein COI89_04460 [Bacillus cereus]PGU67010.1 hypothetical protein COD67_11075 [Bacillus cereus]